MVVATFDTLKFANALKAAGVPDKQAEAEAAILSEALAVNLKELVTKDDLTQAINGLRTELKNDIGGLRAELKNDIRETEQRLNARIDLVRADLNAKIDAAVAKLTGDNTLLKWMVGLSISLSVALLVRLFFFRIP